VIDDGFGMSSSDDKSSSAQPVDGIVSTEGERLGRCNL
jgi:hypothetical protein